jgi:hypothetical protein
MRVPNFSNRLPTFAAWLLAGSIGFACVPQADAGAICKPALSIKKAELSQMRLPTLERRWTAIVSADASRCATTAGYFEAGFSRLKENSVELEFREEFVWSAPSVQISVDFAPDEAVESYWIDSVQVCPCAK